MESWNDKKLIVITEDFVVHSSREGWSRFCDRRIGESKYVHDRDGLEPGVYRLQPFVSPDREIYLHESMEIIEDFTGKFSLVVGDNRAYRLEKILEEPEWPIIGHVEDFGDRSVTLFDRIACRHWWLGENTGLKPGYYVPDIRLSDLPNDEFVIKEISSEAAEVFGRWTAERFDLEYWGKYPDVD